jgi:hypothetical protein
LIIAYRTPQLANASRSISPLPKQFAWRLPMSFAQQRIE